MPRADFLRETKQRRGAWFVCALALVAVAYGQTDHIDQLIADFNNADYHVADRAVEELGHNFGALPVERLIPLLTDSTLMVRMRAASALGEIKDPRAVEPLVAMLKATQDNLIGRQSAVSAARALGDIKDPRAVEPLITALNGGYGYDSDLRENAALALGQIKDPRAVKSLLAALYGSRDVQYGATKALGNIGTPEVVESVIGLAGRAATAATPAAPVYEVLAEIKNPSAIGALTAALKSEFPNVRQGATKALANIGTAETVEPLISALADPLRDVANIAVGALGEIKDPRAVEPLVAILRDTKDDDASHPFDSVKRTRAALALGKIRDPRAIEPLLTALTDKYSNVRKGAADAFGYVGSLGVEPLTASLRDPSPDVRRSAAAALGYTKAPSAVDPLIAALKDDPNSNVRQSAADALGSTKDRRAVGPLSGALMDAPAVRQVAAVALIESRASDAIPEALRKRFTVVVAEVYPIVIHRGITGSEQALILALNEEGDARMATTFLNCGNLSLEAAAREWAKKRGMQITTSPYGDFPRWGR